ncbi:MAG: 50S ribosomal protein L11 methyltransferase [Bacteroidota bacterium]
MNYLELLVKNVYGETREILIYRLAELGFESFSELEDGLLAYVPSGSEKNEETSMLLNEYSLDFEWNLIPEQNWNETWEKNYPPVLTSNRCYVRSPFHEPLPEAEFDLVIEPKMSFGTAHHETTSLMIELIMGIDFSETRVLDMGCGTGVLAILAAKMGANEVIGVDIDEWSFLNAEENSLRNGEERIKIMMGGIEVINKMECDILFANINRNVLLDQIPVYGTILRKGILLLSGFYESDLEVILACAASVGFNLDQTITKNQWMAVKLTK